MKWLIHSFAMTGVLDCNRNKLVRCWARNMHACTKKGYKDKDRHTIARKLNWYDVSMQTDPHSTPVAPYGTWNRFFTKDSFSSVAIRASKSSLKLCRTGGAAFLLGLVSDRPNRDPQSSQPLLTVPSVQKYQANKLGVYDLNATSPLVNLN